MRSPSIAWKAPVNKLAQDETKLRALITELKAHGQLLFVSIRAAQPSAGCLRRSARDEGVLVRLSPGPGMRRIADLHAPKQNRRPRCAMHCRGCPPRIRMAAARFDWPTSARRNSPCCAAFDDDLAGASADQQPHSRACSPQIHRLERVLDRRLDIRPCSICLSDTRRAPSLPRPAKNLATAYKLAPRMGRSLAAESFRRSAKQAVTVPGTQAATIVMPRLPSSSLLTQATRRGCQRS